MKTGGRESKGETDARAEREATRRSGMAYAAGLALFFSVVSFMGVGWLLDNWLGTEWLMIAGIFVGAIAGFIEFIAIMSKLNK